MISYLLVVWQVNHKSTSVRRRATKSSKNPAPCTVVVMKVASDQKIIYQVSRPISSMSVYVWNT